MYGAGSFRGANIARHKAVYSTQHSISVTRSGQA